MENLAETLNLSCTVSYHKLVIFLLDKNSDGHLIKLFAKAKLKLNINSTYLFVFSLNIKICML